MSSNRDLSPQKGEDSHRFEVSVAVPGSIKVTGHVQVPPSGKGDSLPKRLALPALDSLEDSLLIIGALLAISATVFSSNDSLFFWGVTLAGLGKSLPSLLSNAIELQPSTFRRLRTQPANSVDPLTCRNRSHLLVLVGDVALAVVTAGGMVLHYLGDQTIFEVAEIVVVGFVIKACFDIAGDVEWVRGNEDDQIAPEDILLISFALATLVIFNFSNAQLTATGGVALLATFWGKALPSIPKHPERPILPDGSNKVEIQIELKHAP